MTMIDTPDGIAFARAAARVGALHLEIETGMKRRGQTAYAIVKDVYGFTGNRQAVHDMLRDYVDGVLEIKHWTEERGKRAAETVAEATRRAEEEYGPTGYTKDTIDSNIQAFFEAGAITEQEGNDACFLLFIEVVRQYAGSR